MRWSKSEEEYVKEEERGFEPKPEEPKEPEPRSEFVEEKRQSRVFDPGGTTSCTNVDAKS